MALRLKIFLKKNSFIRKIDTKMFTYEFSALGCICKWELATLVFTEDRRKKVYQGKLSENLWLVSRRVLLSGCSSLELLGEDPDLSSRNRTWKKWSILSIRLNTFLSINCLAQWKQFLTNRKQSDLKEKLVNQK